MGNSKVRKKKLVSVVVTTYNYEKYICEALDSISNQTYPNLELIVMDDCSTDNTEKVVKQWYSKNKGRFDNYIYMRLPRNCSSAWCMNIAFQLSKGEYIVIHDSDDISHSDKIKKQVNHLESNPEVSAVGSKFRVFIDTPEKMAWAASWLSYDIKEIQKNYNKNPMKHCVSFGTLLFRADIINTIIGCKRIFGVANDVNFVRDIVRNGYVLDNLDEMLFYVRLHSKRRKSYYKNLRKKHNRKQRTKIKDRVSVVLPITDKSYNTLKAFKSIINQNYHDIEIILIDDGTRTDINSVINKWYRRYGSLYKNINIKDIIYVKLPVSVGYPWTYNIGAYLSKGKYIAFHGTEGKSLRNKIKKQVDFLRNNSDYSVVGTNNNNENFCIKYGDDLKHSYLVKNDSCMDINTIMIKSNIIDEVAGLNKKLKGREDFEFIYRLIYNGYKINNLDRKLYYNE